MNRAICWLVGLVLLLTEGAAPTRAALFEENFDHPPLENGWRAFGDDSLFQWNAAAQQLEVTWDSARPNSFFHRSLGTVLTRQDDFSLAFDLRLDEVRIGVDPSKPYTFELAVGFLHWAGATRPDFVRGKRTGTRNVVEFDYFPDFETFGATVALTVVSSNSLFRYSHNFPMELPPGDLFRITFGYSAHRQLLSTTITRNGEPFQPIEDLALDPAFSDFRLDTLAISSYSDAQADGSLLAHGSIDRIVLRTPDPPVTVLAGRAADLRWQVSFDARARWTYALERTRDWRAWREVARTVAGNDERLVLEDPEPVGGSGFYRVRAERP